MQGDLGSSVLVVLFYCLLSICQYLVLFASCVFVTHDNNEVFCAILAFDLPFQIKVLVVQSTSTMTTKL